MRPEELRLEIMRLKERCLRMAPEVMGDEPGAVEDNWRLEGRIPERAHLAEASPAGDGGSVS